VVNDGYNGFLVPVKDAKSLSQAMERMIALTSRERDIMGKRGRLKVMSEFDDRIIIKDYLDTINSYFESPSLSKAFK
jgi:glycosyltransferase involved in cell wall biosynthesis